MITKYKSEIKMMKSLNFFSEIKDMVLPTMLNIMMAEHLKCDPWMTPEIETGVKTNLMLTMIHINSRYHHMLNLDLFDDDDIGDVEEFKLFVTEMCKYDGCLKTIMESKSANH